MDYIKVLQMLADPAHKQTVLSEMSKTLTAYGLTTQESEVFLHSFIHKTPATELTTKLSITQEQLNQVYDSALNKVQSKLKQQ